MPVLIKINLTGGREIYFNASLISVVYEGDKGTRIKTSDGKEYECLESPETIDRKIDKQIWNMMSNE